MPRNILCAYVCVCVCVFVSARTYAFAYVRILLLLNTCPGNSRNLNANININIFKNHKYSVLLSHITTNLYSLKYSRNLLQQIRFGRKYILFQTVWNVYKLSEVYGLDTQPDKSMPFISLLAKY